MFAHSITQEEIERLELKAFPGRICVVERDGQEFRDAVNYLENRKIIGFDTESRPCFSADQPHYGVSLLQLSGSDKAFLFRIKTLGMRKELCAILSNPNIIKVGAAVRDDIRGLQKYARFTANGFVDLQKMVEKYGIADKSVKKMTAIVLGFRISKTQQLSNWEAESLSDAQQLYAATDAWVCREMYKKLLSVEQPLPPADFTQK